ncbi:MAG TPA: helix-turn-helix domain-containing protein [Pseudonocardiaceae bacterium]|nr:helix-turn-helix domain-containing protein [Pseudonocardiaceae bacterium]
MGRSNGDGGARAESLAVRVLARVPALTDALVRTIEDRNPGYRVVGLVPQDDLWRSCHDNLTRALEMIAERSDRCPDTDRRHDAARATGRRRAEQRMPLDDVLRSFRLGGRLVWEALIEQARVDQLADTDALLELATRVWEVVDATSAQVAAAYHATESDLLRADEQRQAALWEGLLHGRAKDLAFAYEASRIIGMPVAGAYAVVVADIDAGSDRNAVLLHRRLAVREICSAWQVRADSLVGLVLLGEPTVTDPTSNDSAVDSALDDSALDPALEILQDMLAVPAGVSLTVRGLTEIDVAYRQAVLARRTLPAGHDDVAVLAERLPEALLLSAPELAEHLVHRWLADLLTVPAAERRLLLGTLQIWVATGGSIRDTAQAACCHRNTVINRLQRMRAITGNDFTDRAAQVELALAMRASSLLSGPRHD